MGERPGELGYDGLADATDNVTPPLTPPQEYLAGEANASDAFYGTPLTEGTAPMPTEGYTAGTSAGNLTGYPAGNMAATTNTTDNQADMTEGQNPDQIRHDIQRTRQHMTSTVNAIQDKLSPQHLVHEATSAVHDATIGRAEQVMNDVSDTVQNAGTNILDTIRENPIPAVLAAAGLGWLAYKAITNAQSNNQYNDGYRNYGNGYRSDSSYRGVNGYTAGYDQFGRRLPAYQGYSQSYGQNYGQNQSAMSQATNAVQDAASNVANKAQDVASNVASTVQDAAGNVAETAQQWANQAQDEAQQLGYEAEWQMERAKNWLERTWESNPLAVGAAALAAGAIIGGLLPETPMEDRLMGDTRDNLLQKAEGVAQETVQKAQSAAEQALHQVKQDVVSQQQPASSSKSQPQSGSATKAESKSAGPTSSQTSGSQTSGASSSSSSASKSASTGTTGSTTGNTASKQTPPPPTSGNTSSQTQSPAR